MESKDKKGKHLTLTDRINILNDLIKGESLTNIAKKLHKDTTTISKEVKLHRYCKNNNFNGSTSCKNCNNLSTCKLTNLCKNNNCTKVCKSCKAIDSSTLCDNYSEKICKTTARFPYTCHNCDKKAGCKLNKYYYDPNIAQKEYQDLLIESRTGINMTTLEFNEFDAIISDGIKKGKSIYSIVLNHPELNKSERTIYRYINYSYLSATNMDLRSKVKMKPRKDYKNALSKEKQANKKEIIQPRNYDAYLKYIAGNRTSDIPQFDLVQGIKGENEPYLMAFIFPFSNFMIGFLIPNKEQKEIVKVFNNLETCLGLDNFKKLFPACLTDRGNEFLAANEIETSFDGSKRTNIFYCDPYSSCQKAEIERNHEFIRFYSPKGKSLKEFTQEEIDLMFSHINSYNRKVKDGRTPYEIFEFIYGVEIINKLNIKKIEFNDLDLTRDLFVKFIKVNNLKIIC